MRASPLIIAGFATLLVGLLLAINSPLVFAAFPSSVLPSDSTGWSSSRVTATGDGLVHGPFGAETTQIFRTVDNLAPHSLLQLRFRYWAIDSWDNNERGEARVGGRVVWLKTRTSASNCNGWNRYGGQFPNPWNGDNINHKCYTDVNITIPHTSSSFTLTFRGTINQHRSDESWAVNRISLDVIVVDSTPPEVTPNVSVSWLVVDPDSQVTSSSGCTLITQSIDTDGRNFTCSATYAGGTTSETVTIKVDKTDPSVTAGALPAPNINVWNNSDVTVSANGTDGGSGILAGTCTNVLLNNEGSGQSAQVS